MQPKHEVWILWLITASPTGQAQILAPTSEALTQGLTTKNTDIQNQIQASLVEEEFENENKLLLGLTLIFITGLVIIYLFSKYKLLLWQRNLSLRKLFKWRQLGQRAQIQII